MISEKMWKFIHKKYGGGPTLKWKVEDKKQMVKFIKKRSSRMKMGESQDFGKLVFTNMSSDSAS